MDSADVSLSKLVSLVFVYDVEADTEVLVLASNSAIAQYPVYEHKLVTIINAYRTTRHPLTIMLLLFPELCLR